jgi:hypothetical protein
MRSKLQHKHTHQGLAQLVLQHHDPVRVHYIRLKPTVAQQLGGTFGGAMPVVDHHHFSSAHKEET